MIEPYRVKITRIVRNMNTKLVESWTNLLRKMDDRKLELERLREKKRAHKLLKKEKERI
jgi:hypothetical protein